MIEKPTQIYNPIYIEQEAEITKARATIRVFCVISYDCFKEPWISDMFNFFGDAFNIEANEGDITKSCKVWFWTDRIELKENESKYVSVHGQKEENGSIVKWNVTKW